MLFNSFEFLLFFPVVTIIYLMLPHKYRWLHLLLSSCVFYAWFTPAYLLVLFSTIIIDYIAGIYIERSLGSKRRALLILSIISNLTILGVFKYYNFFIENVNAVLHLAKLTHAQLRTRSIILPMGLSFHTFQAMSYTIEIYRGNYKAERHFGIYSLYIMFYPQLMAGPIERPAHMLPQFYEKKTPTYTDISDGLKLMLWGLFKKSVIADRLAITVDYVYANPRHHTNIDAFLATFLFAFQILCDFSGYTDMARGAARIMGFSLVKNFDHPFTSRSVTEFWRRWHISLSSWFNDYVFTPVATSMRNGGKLAIVFALLLTFFLSGLWHGAGWNFIIYGLLNGAAVAYELLTRNARKKLFSHIPMRLGNALSMLLTFSYCAMTWIFFRAANAQEALGMLKQIPHAFTDFAHAIITRSRITAIIPLKMLLGSLSLVALLELVHLAQRKKDIVQLINSKPLVVRWTLYYLLCAIIVFFGVFEHRQFIYFQF